MSQGLSKKRSFPEVDAQVMEKYTRGATNFKISSKHKGERKTMEEERDLIVSNAEKTAMAEVLLPSEYGYIESNGDEETKIYKLKQRDMLPQVDMNTAKNAFDLQLLKFGPYTMDYSRNGRYLLFGGQKGHLAVMDCMRMRLVTEVQLEDTIHSVKYLHNETMFAVAQKKYT